MTFFNFNVRIISKLTVPIETENEHEIKDQNYA